jgi:aspartate kinase
VPKARLLDKVSFEEMLEMASLGSKVLQTRSVELAMVYRVRTRVLSSFVAPGAMKAVDMANLEDIGTIVCDEDEIVEQQVVSGIAYAKDEAKVTILKVADKPGVAAAHLRAAGRGQHQRRHDRPERDARRPAYRHDLYRSGGELPRALEV